MLENTLMPLSEVQNIFMDSLHSDSSLAISLIDPMLNLSPQKCIDIYKRGYIARLTEALGETFEASWWVLGDEDFFKITRSYIQTTPSNEYDLSDYGKDFPLFLQLQNKLITDLPFIFDLARFELIFKDIFHKPNVQDTGLHKLAADHFERIFSLSTSAALFESEFSVYQIWKHKNKDIESLDTISLSSHQRLLIYKQNSQVHVLTLEIDEWLTLNALASTGSLEKTIDIITEWLPEVTSERIQQIFSLISSLNVFNISYRL